MRVPRLKQKTLILSGDSVESLRLVVVQTMNSSPRIDELHTFSEARSQALPTRGCSERERCDHNRG